MSKITYTPGPWVCHSGMVYKDGPNVWPRGTGDGVPIARMDRDTPYTSPVERDCNAGLIATAPEMLEFIEMVAMGNTEFEVLEARARELIKQARRNDYHK